MLTRYVTLWSWPLTRWPWKFVYIKRHVIKVCTKFERNRAIPAKLLIILRVFAHVLSRRDLGLWPLDLELLQRFGCHILKLHTKFERNRIIHGWVIGAFSWVRGPIFTKLGKDIGRSSQHCTLFQILDILLHFQTRVAQSWVMFLNTLLTSCENSGRVGEIFIPIIEVLHYTTEPPEYIWWPSTARLLSAMGWYRKKF